MRFSKLSLLDQLFHTVASPPVAYLLFLVGLALLIFEFFTAGVGIAGVVGAGCTILACFGIAELPARWWAVGLLVAAMVAFAVDVQVGIPRFWTGVGIVFTIIGSFWLFEPVSGSSLRPNWLSLIAGIGGTMLAFIVGMPSMTRTRFATPTIGREWLIGSEGVAVSPVDPDGVVQDRRGAMAGAHQPGDADQGRRAAAGRRHRRRHARGRTARRRRQGLPRAPRQDSGATADVTIGSTLGTGRGPAIRRSSRRRGDAPCVELGEQRERRTCG